MKTLYSHFWVRLLALMCFSLTLWFALLQRATVAAPSDVSVNGLVTDAAGKPVRGAPVTASSGDVSISRFTDASGKYKISGLKPGNYTIVVTAWGYGTKSVSKEISGDATDVPFSLKEVWNPRIISTAEYVSAYPRDTDMRTVQTSCGAPCHNTAWINRRRGMTEEEWTNFIPNMGNKFIHPNPSEAQLKVLSSAVAKFFGPDSPMPTKDQVQHVDISDEALDATIRMYRPPTSNFSIAPHIGASGQIWFTEFDNNSNKIAVLNPATGEIREMPMLSASAGPHNPWVARNGMVWVTENGPIGGKKIAMVDPETGKVIELTPPPGCNCTHTIKEDSQGNMWMSSKMTKLDPKTHKFTVYNTPNTYDLAIDSHDNAWGATGSSTGGFAGLYKVDGKTGDVKLFPVPDLKATFSVGNAVRGMDADSEDNIWFGDTLNHRLGRFNQKTEQITYFKSPTANMSPYGVLVDRKTGEIWASDFDDSNVIRLNPTTGKIIQYPFPTRLIMTRFLAEDRDGKIWFSDFENGRVGVLDPGHPKTSAQR